MTKLSIIIPCYNAEPYIHELLDIINMQLTDEVEVLIIDDGSSIPFRTDYAWAKVIRKPNGGCATARNMGLDNAVGEYVAFIDADDMIPISFVNKVLEKAAGGYDVIDFSWRSLSKEGTQHNHRLRGDDDWLSNPSVCTRAFKRSFIGDTRFNELKDSTEDEDFSRKLGYIYKDPVIKHGTITDYLYFYRTAVTNSKIKRFKKGIMKTKRIVYYYDKVAADRIDILEEIKREDQRNEVWLLTNSCEIPEMRRYCQIHKPMAIWTHYLRGEPYSRCTVIPVPKIYDVVMYCEYCNRIGGISTFIFNWCKTFRTRYRILFMYDRLPDLQLKRLQEIVDCQKKDNSEITCDTLILNRLTDKIPENVRYKKTVQMCHCCRINRWNIPQDRDYIVNVSEASKSSWGEQAKNGIVIHNVANIEAKKALLIVSATRIGASDKGSNDARYRKLAKMLENAKIPYIWLNFCDKPLINMPENFINMAAALNVQDYIKKADYLVQLSDKEAYSYSILEALTNNTAVICTPFDSAIEQGVEDSKTGYIVPFDMNFDVTKLLKVPKFIFSYENDKIIEQWDEILTAKAAERPEPESPELVKVKVVRTYKDKLLNKMLLVGQVLEMTKPRAEQVASIGYVKIL